MATQKQLYESAVRAIEEAMADAKKYRDKGAGFSEFEYGHKRYAAGALHMWAMASTSSWNAKYYLILEALVYPKEEGETSAER